MADWRRFAEDLGGTVEHVGPLRDALSLCLDGSAAKQLMEQFPSGSGALSVHHRRRHLVRTAAGQLAAIGDGIAMALAAALPSSLAEMLHFISPISPPPSVSSPTRAVVVDEHAESAASASSHTRRSLLNSSPPGPVNVPQQLINKAPQQLINTSTPQRMRMHHPQQVMQGFLNKTDTPPAGYAHASGTVSLRTPGPYSKTTLQYGDVAFAAWTGFNNSGSSKAFGVVM